MVTAPAALLVLRPIEVRIADLAGNPLVRQVKGQGGKRAAVTAAGRVVRVTVRSRVMMDPAMMDHVRVESRARRVASSRPARPARSSSLGRPVTTLRRVHSATRRLSACPLRRSGNASMTVAAIRRTHPRAPSGCMGTMPSRPRWQIQRAGCGVCC
jgi:hypothetical protein